MSEARRDRGEQRVGGCPRSSQRAGSSPGTVRAADGGDGGDTSSRLPNITANRGRSRVRECAGMSLDEDDRLRSDAASAVTEACRQATRPPAARLRGNVP